MYPIAFDDVNNTFAYKVNVNTVVKEKTKISFSLGNVLLLIQQSTQNNKTMRLYKASAIKITRCDLKDKRL